MLLNVLLSIPLGPAIFWSLFGSLILFAIVVSVRASYSARRRSVELKSSGVAGGQPEFLEQDQNIPVQEDFVMYDIDEKDANLFIDRFYTWLSIRIFKPKYDETRIQTSEGHKFDQDDDHLALRAVVPQLEKVTAVKGTTMITLVKSSAAKWEDIKDPILTFLFAHMRRAYSWKIDKQLVTIETTMNPDILTFNLNVKTKDHRGLGYSLQDINGIVSSIPGRSLPANMENDGNYFDLKKSEGATWDELLPKVKDVFRKYFLGGVDFQNCYPPVPTPVTGNE